MTRDGTRRWARPPGRAWAFLIGCAERSTTNSRAARSISHGAGPPRSAGVVVVADSADRPRLELSLRRLRLRRLRVGDPRAHRGADRVAHPRPPRRHGREIRRRRAVHVPFAVDLSHQRSQRLGHAGPALGKLDLGHAPILPGPSSSGKKLVWRARTHTFSLRIRVLPRFGRHSIGSTPLRAGVVLTYRSIGSGLAVAHRLRNYQPWTTDAHGTGCQSAGFDSGGASDRRTSARRTRTKGLRSATADHCSSVPSSS